MRQPGTHLSKSDLSKLTNYDVIYSVSEKVFYMKLSSSFYDLSKTTGESRARKNIADSPFYVYRGTIQGKGKWISLMNQALYEGELSE